VWNPTELQKRKRKRNKGGGKKRQHKERKKFASGLPYFCTPLVWVPGVIDALLCGCKTLKKQKADKPKTRNKKLCSTLDPVNLLSICFKYCSP